MSVVRGSVAGPSRLWVVVAAAVLTLAACSDGGQDDPEATPSSPSATPVATAPSTAPTTDAPVALPSIDELVIAPGRVGPVRAGMSKDEALATGLFDADVEVPGEGCGRVEPLAWKTDYRSSLDVLTTDDGTVVSLGVRGDQPRTAEVLGVGSTLRQVSDVYENAELTEAGFGQTGVFVTEGEQWIGFLFDADPETIGPKAKVLMVEATQGTKPDLMRDGC